MAPLCCWVAAAACVACALPMSTPAAAAGAAPLPRVRIDPAGVSVSGISSGADMVVQLQVAYSDVFAGVGVFAGQSYHCAVHRFPDDELAPSDTKVPYCDGCPPGKTLTYDHCKRHPEWTADPAPLVKYAQQQAALGSIAPLDNLRGKRAFLYRGQNDTCYNKGSVNATANFFRRLMPAASVFFETKVESPHLVPGVDPYLCWWEEWGGPDNCTYDGAGHALRWIYGDRALGNGRDNSTAALAKKLAAFDQRPYFPKNGQDPLLADAGEIFVPDVCMAAGAGVGAGAGCKLHFFFHGCGVTPTFDVFAAYGGFNEWAEKNGIVVVYPRMSTRGSTSQEHSGCWDGYGQTGADYDLRSGLQMQTIANMVAALVNGTRAQ